MLQSGEKSKLKFSNIGTTIGADASNYGGKNTEKFNGNLNESEPRNQSYISTIEEHGKQLLSSDNIKGANDHNNIAPGGVYANYTYSSMVDPVITNKDVEKSERRFRKLSHQKNTTDDYAIIDNDDDYNNSTLSSTMKEYRKSNSFTSGTDNGGGFFRRFSIGHKKSKSRNEDGDSTIGKNFKMPDIQQQHQYIENKVPSYKDSQYFDNNKGMPVKSDNEFHILEDHGDGKVSAPSYYNTNYKTSNMIEHNLSQKVSDSNLVGDKLRTTGSVGAENVYDNPKKLHIPKDLDNVSYEMRKDVGKDTPLSGTDASICGSHSATDSNTVGSGLNDEVHNFLKNNKSQDYKASFDPNKSRRGLDLHPSSKNTDNNVIDKQKSTDNKLNKNENSENKNNGGVWSTLTNYLGMGGNFSEHGHEISNEQKDNYYGNKNYHSRMPGSLKLKTSQSVNTGIPSRLDKYYESSAPHSYPVTKENTMTDAYDNLYTNPKHDHNNTIKKDIATPGKLKNSITHDVTSDMLTESTPYRMIQDPTHHHYLKSENPQSLKIDKTDHNMDIATAAAVAALSSHDQSGQYNKFQPDHKLNHHASRVLKNNENMVMGNNETLDKNNKTTSSGAYNGNTNIEKNYKDLPNKTTAAPTKKNEEDVYYLLNDLAGNKLHTDKRNTHPSYNYSSQNTDDKTKKVKSNLPGTDFYHSGLGAYSSTPVEYHKINNGIKSINEEDININNETDTGTNINPNLNTDIKENIDACSTQNTNTGINPNANTGMNPDDKMDVKDWENKMKSNTDNASNIFNINTSYSTNQKKENMDQYEDFCRDKDGHWNSHSAVTSDAFSYNKPANVIKDPPNSKLKPEQPEKREKQALNKIKHLFTTKDKKSRKGSIEKKDIQKSSSTSNKNTDTVGASITGSGGNYPYDTTTGLGISTGSETQNQGLEQKVAESTNNHGSSSHKHRKSLLKSIKEAF